MNDHGRNVPAGPGTSWLARRMARRPEELTGSPAAAAAAMGDLMREAAGLAARLDSSDPDVRAAAEAEAEQLRRQIEAAPPPSQTFGKRVAQILRDAADRLDHKPD